MLKCGKNVICNVFGYWYIKVKNKKKPLVKRNKRYTHLGAFISTSFFFVFSPLFNYGSTKQKKTLPNMICPLPFWHNTPKKKNDVHTRMRIIQK